MRDVNRRSLITSTALVTPLLAGSKSARVDTRATEAIKAFTGGAAYFRESNPPPEEWARDYRAAAAAGMDNFRHWHVALQLQLGLDVQPKWSVVQSMST